MKFGISFFFSFFATILAVQTAVATSSVATTNPCTPYSKCPGYNFGAYNSFPAKTFSWSNVQHLSGTSYKLTLTFNSLVSCPAPGTTNALSELKIIGLSVPSGYSSTIVLYSDNSNVHSITDACHWSADIVVKGDPYGNDYCMKSFQV